MKKFYKSFICCALILSTIFCLSACGEKKLKGIYSDYAVVVKHVEYDGHDYTQVHVNFRAELKDEQITIIPSNFKIKTLAKHFTASYFVVDYEDVVSSLTLEGGTDDYDDSIYSYSENVVLLLPGIDLDYNDNFTLYYNDVEIYHN